MLIKKSEYKKALWKNGGGTTFEIDRFEKTGPYLWRLSQAIIEQDGPFSVFEGYDRLLVVVDGPGVFLNERKLEPLKPAQFSGDDAINCRLIGANVTDLGLIFNRSKIRAEMKIVSGSLQLTKSAVHYFYSLESGETLKVENQDRTEVSRSIQITVEKIVSRV